MSKSATQNDSTDSEITPLDANNHVRGTLGGCLIVEEMIQGETVETAFIAVNRTFFRVKEFGKPSKVKRHTMSEALRKAQESDAKSARLSKYSESELDLNEAVRFIRENFETEDKESNAGYGAPKEHLNGDDGEVLDSAAGPIDDSKTHGGGW